MRLADDRRARVPFALVGVLLLVGSATLGASLLDQHDRTPEVDAGAAVDRADAAVQTVVRDAVADASRRAAAAPVVEPANTRYGRVINDSTPFRDALRIRIYLAVQSRLGAVDKRVRSAGATASLPPVTNASDLRAAKRRVTVDRAGEGRVAVTVRNVSFVAEHDGQTVARERRTVDVTVPTPVLLLHDRVERYKDRLNRGALDGPGFGRRVAARLYAMAWARGYAQYGGAPVANVVGNRHVELAANGAALETQRSVFGRADPGGRVGLAKGTARVGITDALAETNVSGQGWVDYVLGEGDPPNGTLPGVGNATGPVSPGRTTTVGVNYTADVAATALLTGSEGPSLSAVVDDAYGTKARLVSNSRTVRPSVRPRTEPAGGNWTLNDTRRETDVTVTDGRASLPSVPPGWHELRSYRRVVAERTDAHREWTRGNETVWTTDRWTTRHRVGIRLVGTHAAGERVPNRPVRGVHAPGGALDGPNLAGIERRAARRLVVDRGGANELARAVADGDDVDGTVTVGGRQPDGVERWAYRDVADLRERVRNVSVTVERAGLATGANPPAELAAKLRSRRSALVDPPGRYDGVADRARVGVRAAYVDRTIRLLERQAEVVAETQAELDDALGDLGAVTGDRLQDLIDAARAVDQPGRHVVATDGGPTTLRVDGAPAYLTTASVDHDRVPAVADGETYHPLVARNENVVTVPYGDAAEGIVGEFVDDTTRVDLRTAAKTLRETNRALDAVDDEGVVASRRNLWSAVRKGLRNATDATAAELAAATALSRRESRDAVRDGLSEWDSTAARAIALANGSAAAPIADAAAARSGTPAAPAWRDRVRTRLRVATSEAMEDGSVRPPEGPVRDAASSLRAAARSRLEGAVEDGLRRAGDRATKRLARARTAVPAGVPVTPIPGYWFATANAWQVDLGGRYARFTVRAGRDSPATPGATVAYSRDGSPVSVDVDGDGEGERLGRSTRVSFEASTTVLVVVPPGKSGVGDVDGQRTEESPGWPDAGRADLKPLVG
ncbi:DUF7286 family protein [Halostella litorea]|uniref:DUF7286 family protein n=1 Tax=Halostella litorea TaxID=2528831 RepID=UPI00109232EF|nr:hypothetical protein [Halostella litorea]